MREPWAKRKEHGNCDCTLSVGTILRFSYANCYNLVTEFFTTLYAVFTYPRGPLFITRSIVRNSLKHRYQFHSFLNVHSLSILYTCTSGRYNHEKNSFFGLKLGCPYRSSQGTQATKFTKSLSKGLPPDLAKTQAVPAWLQCVETPNANPL